MSSVAQYLGGLGAYNNQAYGQQTAQQGLLYNALSNAWQYGGTVTYEAPPVGIAVTERDTAVRWLDRRVNEMRVRL